MVMCVSCDDAYEDAAKADSRLVVEGWIDEGGFPVVMLTRSLPVSSNYESIDSLSDYVIRWARVAVSNGTDTVVLTGKYDNRYFPPFIYTTGNMRGTAGGRYELMVDYRDFKATATTTIPTSKPLPVFNVERIDGTDSLFAVNATIGKDGKQPHYYQIFTHCDRSSSNTTVARQFQAAYLGSIDDNVISGKAVIPVYRGQQLGTLENYTPYFHEGERLTIKFAEVDQASFRFWDSYTKN